MPIKTNGNIKSKPVTNIPQVTTTSHEEAKTITKTTTFAPNDTILCRSITAGILYVSGKKSGNSYTFAGNGDTAYIEYQDLLALYMNKADSVWMPRFIIEDERIFEDVRWARLKPVYDALYNTEIEEILALDKGDFEATLRHAPDGLKDAIKTTVATRVADGEFDSISKVKVFDKICGTEIRKILLED